MTIRGPGSHFNPGAQTSFIHACRPMGERSRPRHPVCIEERVRAFTTAMCCVSNLLVIALHSASQHGLGHSVGEWTDTLPSEGRDRKSTRLNSSHVKISYAVFCL